MVWSLAFGCLILLVVVLKYLQPWGERCPQCHARRADPEHPLCPECGWIFEVPGDDDDDEEEDPDYEENVIY